MKIASVLYDDHAPFNTFFPQAELLCIEDAGEITKDISFIILHGGADISPSLYNAPMAKETYASERPSRRDTIEWECLQRAAELGVPIFGICRGAQMLCAAAGGRLIQHVNNHSGRHYVKDFNGNKFTVNSIHHQMQYPFEVDHQLLAWCPEPLSDVHVDPLGTKPMSLEPEAVYYPKIKGFGVQWHPEMLDPNHESNRWVLSQMRGLFNV